MRQAVILVNGYSESESELYQSKRLKKELENLSVRVDVLKNGGVYAYLGGKGELKNKLVDYDFCVYLDKDRYLSAELEQSGMRLFNPHAAIAACDDKMQTFLCLSGRGIPMPRTVAGALCYTAGAHAKEETLDRVVKKLGLPVVVKECYGSLGKGVYKADNMDELRRLADSVLFKPHLFQEFIAESAGRDVRVICVGGEALCAMERRSSGGEFRSNLGLGGNGEAYPVTDDIRKLTAEICSALSLDYCGIDLLFGKEGFLVCEVNSNAFFGGMERVTGVNVAKAYAEYIVKTMYEG